MLSSTCRARPRYVDEEPDDEEPDDEEPDDEEPDDELDSDFAAGAALSAFLAGASDLVAEGFVSELDVESLFPSDFFVEE